MEEQTPATFVNVDERENHNATESSINEDQICFISTIASPAPPPSPVLSSPTKEASNKERESGSVYEREEFFKRMFSLTENERILEEHSCAYYNRILLRGRMYITENHILFYSNILGRKTVVKIAARDIADVLKRNSAYVLPSAIEIYTRETSYFFASFTHRDLAFKRIHTLWLQQMKSLYDEFKTETNNVNTGQKTNASAVKSADDDSKSILAVDSNLPKVKSSTDTTLPPSPIKQTVIQTDISKQLTAEVKEKQASPPDKFLSSSPSLASGFMPSIAGHVMDAASVLVSPIRSLVESKSSNTVPKSPPLTSRRNSHSFHAVHTRSLSESDHNFTLPTPSLIRNNAKRFEESKIDGNNNNDNNNNSNNNSFSGNLQMKRASMPTDSNNSNIDADDSHKEDRISRSPPENMNDLQQSLTSKTDHDIMKRNNRAKSLYDTRRFSDPVKENVPAKPSLSSSPKTNSSFKESMINLVKINTTREQSTAATPTTASVTSTTGNSEQADEIVVPEIKISSPCEDMFYEPTINDDENEGRVSFDLNAFDIFPVHGVKMTKLTDDVILPLSAQELINILYSDDSDFLEEFHKTVGDIEVVIDKLVDFKPGVPTVRCIKMKVDQESAYAALLPPKTPTVLLETQRFMITRNKTNTQTFMIMHSSIASQTLSKDDMFQVECKIFIADRRKTNGIKKECMVQFFAGANCKAAFWRSSMEQTAIKATKKRINTWIKIAQERVEQYRAQKEKKRIEQIRANIEATMLSAIIHYEKQRITDTSMTQFLLPPAPNLSPSPPPSPSTKLPAMYFPDLSNQNSVEGKVKITTKKKQRHINNNSRIEIEMKTFDLTDTTAIKEGFNLVDIQDFNLFSEDKNQTLEYKPSKKEILRNVNENVAAEKKVPSDTSNERDVIGSVIAILRFILISLLQLFKFAREMIGKHASLFTILLLCFYILYMIILNGSIGSKLSAIESEIAVQNRQTRDAFDFTKQILREKENYGEIFIKNKAFGYLLERKKLWSPLSDIIPPLLKLTKLSKSCESS
jgi:hypothetical protein